MTKLQLTKDNEINKLNEQLNSKITEVNSLKKQLESNIPIDYKEKEAQLKKAFETEKETLQKKITDLELKIYKANDKAKQIEKESKAQIEKLQEEINTLKQTGGANENEDEEDQPSNEGEEEEEDNEQNENEENSEHNSNQNDNNKKENDVNIDKYEELKILYDKLQEEFKQQKHINDNLNLKINELTQSHQNELNDINAKHEQLIKRKENTYNKLKEVTSQTINDKNTQLRDLELKLKSSNTELDLTTKSKNELENIVIKQETKISNLTKKINQINLQSNNKNEIIKQNELYVTQLQTIIQDYKTKLTVIKEKKKGEQDEKIIELQNEINSLKNIIECKLLYKYNTYVYS